MLPRHPRLLSFVSLFIMRHLGIGKVFGNMKCVCFKCITAGDLYLGCIRRRQVLLLLPGGFFALANSGHAPYGPREGCFAVNGYKLGFQLFSWVGYP